MTAIAVQSNMLLLLGRSLLLLADPVRVLKAWKCKYYDSTSHVTHANKRCSTKSKKEVLC